MTSNPKLEPSIKEAKRLIKGKRLHCGHRVSMATDTHDGFIIGGHTTPANECDIAHKSI